MIEVVTVENLKALKVDALDMGESFFKSCGLPGTFSFDAWLHNWTMILEKNFGVMWCFRSGDTVAGLLGGILAPDMNDGAMVATEAFWYVKPAYRNTVWSVKLLLNFEIWARDIGAKRIVMAHLLSSMPSQLCSYYERRGYKPVEISYVKTL